MKNKLFLDDVRIPKDAIHKAESSHHELVMVLTQFVIGDREEVEDG